VLVERVEGFSAEEAWQRAYDDIRDFERTLVTEGMILLKFWMHVSDKEQLALAPGAGRVQAGRAAGRRRDRDRGDRGHPSRLDDASGDPLTAA
jgi:hypothetical protein